VIDDAVKIDGRRTQNMLQSSLRQTDVAATAQACDAHSLRDRAFNAGAAVIEALKLRRFLKATPLLQGKMFKVRA